MVMCPLNVTICRINKIPNYDLENECQGQEGENANSAVVCSLTLECTLTHIARDRGDDYTKICKADLSRKLLNCKP